MLELAYRVLYLVRTDNNQLVKRTRKNTPARAHFSASPTPPPRGFPPTRPALSRKGSALHSCVAGQRARAVARTVSLAKRALRRSCLSVGPSGSRRPFLSLGLCGWLSTRRSPSQRLEPRVRQAVVPAEWRVAPIVNSRFPFTNQSLILHAGDSPSACPAGPRHVELGGALPSQVRPSAPPLSSQRLMATAQRPQRSPYCDAPLRPVRGGGPKDRSVIHVHCCVAMKALATPVL